MKEYVITSYETSHVRTWGNRYITYQSDIYSSGNLDSIELIDKNIYSRSRTFIIDVGYYDDTGVIWLKPYNYLFTGPNDTLIGSTVLARVYTTIDVHSGPQEPTENLLTMVLPLRTDGGKVRLTMIVTPNTNGTINVTDMRLDLVSSNTGSLLTPSIQFYELKGGVESVLPVIQTMVDEAVTNETAAMILSDDGFIEGSREIAVNAGTQAAQAVVDDLSMLYTSV
jgi:hypothetical protein